MFADRKVEVTESCGGYLGILIKNDVGNGLVRRARSRDRSAGIVLSADLRRRNNGPLMVKEKCVVQLPALICGMCRWKSEMPKTKTGRHARTFRKMTENEKRRD